MTITRGFSLLFARRLFPLLAAGSLMSCSTSSPNPSGGEVTKVKTYHLTPTPGVRSLDPSISFERKYRMHGAVTGEDKRQRYGNYYDIFWKAKDRSQPATLTFEYFQTRTGSELKTAEPIQVAEPKSSNKNTYTITGDDYEASGPVMAWKFTVTQGGQEVAVEESYLWSETLKRRSKEDAAQDTRTIGGSSVLPTDIGSEELQKLYEKGAEILEDAE